MMEVIEDATLCTRPFQNVSIGWICMTKSLTLSTLATSVNYDRKLAPSLHLAPHGILEYYKDSTWTLFTCLMVLEVWSIFCRLLTHLFHGWRHKQLGEQVLNLGQGSCMRKCTVDSGVSSSALSMVVQNSKVWLRSYSSNMVSLPSCRLCIIQRGTAIRSALIRHWWIQFFEHVERMLLIGHYTLRRLVHAERGKRATHGLNRCVNHT